MHLLYSELMYLIYTFIYILKIILRLFNVQAFCVRGVYIILSIGCIVGLKLGRGRDF